MQQKFLQQAHADLPVYLTDVYRDFQKTGTRPFHLQLTLYDGTARSFPLQLPPADCTEEAAFLAEYIHALLYNLLSSLGARAVDLYFDPADQALQALVATLPEVFQLHTPRLQRTGYGKCLNVNDRILTALLPDAEGFSFRTHPLCDEPEAQSLPVCTGASVLSRLPARATHAMLLGIDVGGTDIKLCASVNGDLCVFKEFDWFPAAFTQADQLTEPIVFLTRLLRAAASLAACGKQERIVQEKQSILDFLTGAENSGKAWFSTFYITPDGKEQHDVVINKIDDSKEGGDWSTDIQEAVNMFCFTMRVHSNLVGSVPGKSQTNNSGSDKRELYTIAQALQKPYHDLLFTVHRIIIRFNGWKGVVPDCPFIQLTTLDEHADAKQVTTNGETDKQ